MKKIISLMLVAVLTLSMVATVSAGSYGKVTLDTPVYTEKTGKIQADYYTVKVKVSDLLELGADDIYMGYNGFQLKIGYDATKFDAGYPSKNAINKPITVYGKFLMPIVDLNAETIVAAPAVSGNKLEEGLFVVAGTTGTATNVYSSYNYGNNEWLEVYLTPKEGATGIGNITIEYVEMSGTNDIKHTSTETGAFTLGNTSVDFGGEEEPDEPVATTVKTFAKRLYLDNTLYTVGVISEGTNFATETIKAGIRIDKAGVMVPYWTNNNNAPVSDGKGTSYYAVALNGVTAETDIKAESVSKAVITVNGGAEISGDEVSTNDTSVE